MIIADITQKARTNRVTGIEIAFYYQCDPSDSLSIELPDCFTVKGQCRTNIYQILLLDPKNRLVLLHKCQIPLISGRTMLLRFIFYFC